MACASFVGGCNHGASGKAEIKAEFEQYKVAQALIVKGIQESAKQDAIAANQKLKNQERNLEENERKQKAELAKLRKQLDDVKLDRDLVRLLNDSALGSRKDEPVAGSGQQGNVSPDEEARPPEATRTVTLGDLSEVIIENNTNHLSCVAQVLEWQDFYRKQYEKFER